MNLKLFVSLASVSAHMTVSKATNMTQLTGLLEVEQAMNMFKRSYLDPDSIFRFNGQNLDSNYAASLYKRFWVPAKRHW